MIASARMYAVTPAAGALWRQLLEAIVARAGLAVEVLDWPPPLPLAELWNKPGKTAVFMCGLPFSKASPQPELVAAPVPAIAGADDQPRYWSELVVRADSHFHRLSDTFGQRMALTTPDSQSGFAAVLYELMESSHDKPLYREIIAPCVTPYNALLAVVERKAEVAPIDSWAFALMQRHAPELTSRVRIVASTEPTPIPPLIASTGQARLLRSALLAAHRDPSLEPLMESLLLVRFVRPSAESYDILKLRLETALHYWRQHPLAETIDPAFDIEAGIGAGDASSA